MKSIPIKEHYKTTIWKFNLKEIATYTCYTGAWSQSWRWPHTSLREFIFRIQPLWPNLLSHGFRLVHTITLNGHCCPLRLWHTPVLIMWDGKARSSKEFRSIFFSNEIITDGQDVNKASGWNSRGFMFNSFSLPLIQMSIDYNNMYSLSRKCQWCHPVTLPI